MWERLRGVFLGLGLLTLCFTSSGFSQGPPHQLQALLQQVALATYATETQFSFRFLDNGDEETITPSGMGVLLSSGHFLTVSHAVLSYPTNWRVFHHRAYTRTHSRTTIAHMAAVSAGQQEQPVEELALQGELDLAVFSLSGSDRTAHAATTLRLAPPNPSLVDDAIYLVRLRPDAPEGYLVTRGRITAQSGHPSLQRLGVTELDAFYMAEMEHNVLRGDSGSAIVGVPVDAPETLVLVGLVSGALGQNVAVLKAHHFAPYLLLPPPAP